MPNDAARITPLPGNRRNSTTAPAMAAPVAGRARPRFRHAMVLVWFVITVVAPTAGTAWYLWTRATDQYASTVAFSVRKEEAPSALELIGGISDLTGGGTSDSDVLYEYLGSQTLVAELDAEIDLRDAWSAPENDPIFDYTTPGSIEDLVRHWHRMVTVNYDTGTGLIEVQVRSFDPVTSQRIAQAIYDHSTTMINRLNDTARADAIRYAKADLDSAEARLRQARLDLTAFRNRTQIVDPAADLQGQIGLLTNLQAQLAEALIEVDMLRQNSRETDPRITQTELKISVIKNRMSEERRKLGIGGGADTSDAFASLVGEYEGLIVEREFAEKSYQAARAAFDIAQGEARRQSRYLAAHIAPTLSEQAQYPQRATWLGVVVVFLFLFWAILSLVYYSLRDRR